MNSSVASCSIWKAATALNLSTFGARIRGEVFPKRLPLWHLQSAQEELSKSATLGRLADCFVDTKSWSGGRSRSPEQVLDDHLVEGLIIAVGNQLFGLG